MDVLPLTILFCFFYMKNEEKLIYKGDVQTLVKPHLAQTTFAQNCAGLYTELHYAGRPAPKIQYTI